MADSYPPNDPRYVDSRYQSTASAGPLGMAVFIASLTMIFGSCIIGYWVVRSRAPEWPPPGLKIYNPGLFLATLVILLSSVALHFAWLGAKNDRRSWMTRGMLTSTSLGVVFLILQTWNWFELIGPSSLASGDNLFAFTFYMLTGLHALHIIGGLIPAVIVTRRAGAGRYSSAFHPGITYVAMYWHFLTVMWMVLFAVMILGS